MRILLSNDDSVFAPGIEALYHELKKLGEVTVVAPLEEMSTTGHSLTIHKPLRISKLNNGFYGVSGSPADCVYIGIREVLKGKKPDLVVSGINRGANLGQDVYYSGTVSAAREACMMGLRAMAVSLSVNFMKPPPESKLNYKAAGQMAVTVLRELSEIKLPKHTLLNLNVPNVPYSKIKGVRAAKQGFRHYSGTVLKRRDHRGRDYFWVGGQYEGFENEPGSDCLAVAQGYASLTPLRLDCTDHTFMADLVGLRGKKFK